MSRWFQQSYRLVGSMSVDGVIVALPAVVPWDSDHEGQFGHIIECAPWRQHFFLRTYVLNVKPTYCMIAKTSKPRELLDDTHAVLFTTYMDNTYLAFCNVPAQSHTTIRYCVELSQDIRYHVPFKWEPKGQSLNWGACSVICTPETLRVTLKGIPPVSPFFHTAVWDCWPDRWLPNCASVLQSMLPAPVLKGVSLSGNVLWRE